MSTKAEEMSNTAAFKNAPPQPFPMYVTPDIQQRLPQLVPYYLDPMTGRPFTQTMPQPLPEATGHTFAPTQQPAAQPTTIPKSAEANVAAEKEKKSWWSQLWS
jgi:hypothetical protein